MSVKAKKLNHPLTLLRKKDNVIYTDFNYILY